MARFCVCLLAVWCATAIGCGTSSRSEIPPEEENLRNLTKLLGQYSSRNKGRAPKDDQEFKDFVGKLAAPELKALGIDGMDKLFNSTRDKEPFVIRYSQLSKGGGMGDPLPQGKTITIDPTAAVAKSVWVHEKTGTDGKRYVAYATGEVELVDEARFSQLVPSS